MNRRSPLGLLLLLSACARTVPAGEPHVVAPGPELRADEERAVVARVAEQIETHYVREDKARAIAARLRAEAARGAFDRNLEPRALAGALTDRLKREDPHFIVRWEPAVRDAKKGSEAPPATLSEPLRAKRFNQGFRKVEILPGNVAYIELNEFADLEGDDPAATDKAAFKAARDTADAALAFVQNTDAVIFDLRNNGGGGSMCNYVLSYFLPPDLVLGTMRGRKEATETRTFRDIGGARRLDVPIYVLVSGRTGSAAEFFAYSMQARGRAIVVGEPSAGAANPYDDFDAGRGFIVGISVAEPIDARTGGNWAGSGIQPDVRVPSNQALERTEILALERALRGPLDPVSARDARWALEALQPAPPPPSADALSAYVGAYGIRTVRVDAGRLVLERERFPQRVLRFIGNDVFRIEGEPSARVAFERDARGRVVAMTQLSSTRGAWRSPKDVGAAK